MELTPEKLSHKGDIIMLNFDFLDTEAGKQIFEDGKIAIAHDNLIEILALRFENCPKHVFKMIQEIGSLNILKELLRAAIQSSDYEVFYKILTDTLSQSKWKKASKKRSSKKRGTDEAFLGLMNVSGKAVLKLIGLDHIEAEQYIFKSVVLKEKRLEPDMEGIPLFEKDTKKVFIEFQAYRHEYIRYNLGAKVLTACAQEKHSDEVVAAIIYTDNVFKEKALPVNAFSKQLGKKLAHQIKEVVLTDYNLSELMDIDPKLIILAPFTISKDVPTSQLSSNGRQWKTIIQNVFASTEQKDASDVLGLFLLNRFRQLTREEIKAMLDFDILDTVAGRQVWYEAEEKGLEKGIKSLLEAGLLNKDLDKIVQTTGMDYERVKQIIQDISS